MAELLRERRSALHGLSLPGKAGAAVVSEAAAAARFIYRGAPGRVGQSFGVALPVQPCRAARSGERAALWLGPDEWLLIAADADSSAVRRGLTSALSGKAAALVDVSHRSAGLNISGPRAADLLNAGCPLDLGLAEFPAGMCARTLLAKAEIILWRTAPEAFRLEAWRSFMPYVTGLLGEAARGLD